MTPPKHSMQDIDREIMRKDLKHFVAGPSGTGLDGAWHVLEPSTPLAWSWHLDAMILHIQSLLLDLPGPGGSPCPQNLCINVPPGSMKSLCFSVFAPAWMWIDHPSWRSIYASGSPSIVTRDSLKCRQLIKSEWYQQTFKPKWKISADQDEKQKFANTMGGVRTGMGAGVQVTGERADFLGVDDANDAKEIFSKAHRDTINERWWDASFHNRIADPSKSKRGIIMQRLHEEDLAGYVLEKEKGQWAHLCIQMEYEAEGPGDKVTWLGWSDPRTVEGQLLFPERFTPKFLAGELQTLGSAGYAGQMQQRPAPAAGNQFKREWFRFWSPTGIQQARPEGCSNVPPVRFNPAIDHVDEMIQSWDFAFKGKESSDPVSGLCLARVGANKFLLARKNKRMGMPESMKAIAQMRLDWPEAYEIAIEDKANGPAIVDTMSQEITGIVAVDPKGGKEARAAAIQPQIEAGNYYLPEGAEWLGEYIDQFATFPRGKHDDDVDATSQGLLKLSEDSDETAARALLGMGCAP